MTAEYVWSELRERVIAASGDQPNAPLEQRVIDVFREHPAVVAQGVEHVILRYQQGVVRSVWPVLAKHVEDLAGAVERASSITATDTRDRKAVMSRARQWMRTAGIHYDRPDEVEDELRAGFTSGMSGGLKVTHDDDVRELLNLWRELRPLGERVEREADERGRRHVAAQAAMQKPDHPPEHVLDLLRRAELPPPTEEARR